MKVMPNKGHDHGKHCRLEILLAKNRLCGPLGFGFGCGKNLRYRFDLKESGKRERASVSVLVSEVCVWKSWSARMVLVI